MTNRRRVLLVFALGLPALFVCVCSLNDRLLTGPSQLPASVDSPSVGAGSGLTDAKGQSEHKIRVPAGGIADPDVMGVGYRGREVAILISSDLVDLGPLSDRARDGVLKRIAKVAEDARLEMYAKAGDLERGAATGLSGYHAWLQAEEAFQIAMAAQDELSRGFYLVTEAKWAMKPLPMPSNYRAYFGTFDEFVDGKEEIRFIVVPVNMHDWGELKAAAEASAEVRLQAFREFALSFNAKDFSERQKMIEDHFQAKASYSDALKAKDIELAKRLGQRMLRWPFGIDRVQWLLVAPDFAR